MRRKCILSSMVLAMLLFGGCGGRQNNASYIGADQAKQLALNICSKTAEEAESVTADLVRNQDKDYYQVDIVADGQHYQVEMDALTGTVAEVKVSAVDEESDVAGNGQESGADANLTVPEQASPTEAGQPVPEQASPTGAGQPVPEQTSPTEAGQPVSGQENQPDGMEHHSDGYHGDLPASQATFDPAAGSSAGTGAVEGMVTLEDAKGRALEHAGLTAAQVTFVEDKLDYEDGRQVYELEFYTNDHKEYDYEIDAYTGEIVGFDYDAEHYVPSQASGEAITADEAKALALSKVPGAADSDVREFEVDYDDGRTEYEGKIIYNGTEYEFEIDSAGQILSWEEEPVRAR